MHLGHIQGCCKFKHGSTLIFNSLTALNARKTAAHTVIFRTAAREWSSHIIGIKGSQPRPFSLVYVSMCYSFRHSFYLRNILYHQYFVLSIGIFKKYCIRNYSKSLTLKFHSGLFLKGVLNFLLSTPFSSR